MSVDASMTTVRTTSINGYSPSSSSSSPLSSLTRKASPSPFPKTHIGVIMNIFCQQDLMEIRRARRVNTICYRVYQHPVIIKVFADALGILHSPSLTHEDIKKRISAINHWVHDVFRVMEIDIKISYLDPLTEYLHLYDAARKIVRVLSRSNWNSSTLIGSLFCLRITNPQLTSFREKGLDITSDITKDYREMLHYAFTCGSTEQFTFLLTYLPRVQRVDEIRLEESLNKIVARDTVIAKIDILAELRTPQHKLLKDSFVKNGLKHLWKGNEYTRFSHDVDVNVQDKLIELGATVTQDALHELMSLYTLPSDPSYVVSSVPSVLFTRMCGLFIDKYGAFTKEFLVTPIVFTSCYEVNAIFLIKNMSYPVNKQLLLDACANSYHNLITHLVDHCGLVFDSECILASFKSHYYSFRRSWVNLDLLPAPSQEMFDAFFFNEETIQCFISFIERSDRISPTELENWFLRFHFRLNESHVVNLLNVPVAFFHMEDKRVQSSFVKALSRFGLPTTKEAREILTMILPSFKGVDDFEPAPVSSDKDTISRYFNHFLSAMRLAETSKRSLSPLCEKFQHFIDEYELTLSVDDIQTLMRKPEIKRNESFSKWLRQMMPTRKWIT